MTRFTTLQSKRPSWPAVLLFTALLAQAPHAAAVFIRIAPHDAQWEIVTSFIGAWVYAIALEGATAYFVWRSKLRWAIAFALFSIAHNIAYYMPGAWTFDVFGATLTVRYVFSALLISMSLPIAIAAFSHVQAERGDSQPHTSTTMPAETLLARPEGMTGHSSETVAPADTADEAPIDTVPATVQPTPIVAPARKRTPVLRKRKPAKLSADQRRAQIAESGVTDPSAICAQFGVSLRTAQSDIAAVRAATLAQNGATH